MANDQREFANQRICSNITIVDEKKRSLFFMEGFTKRLQQSFDFGSMAEIARRLGIPHATIRNYFQGRLPAPDVLIKIANETNVSLNWLLIGTGPMYVGDPKTLSLGTLFDRRIEEIIDEKFRTRTHDGVRDLGAVDANPDFDVESAVAKYGDPQQVMSEWFKHESRDYPDDFGVVFFQGWESFTPDEKLDAVRDAKKVLDRTLKKK